MRSLLRFHLCQFASQVGEPLKTLRQLEKWLKPLKILPGDFLVFPEMWPSGFKIQDLAKQELENIFCFHWLKSFAAEKKCYLIGSMLELPQKKAYNSAYLIGPERKLLGHYRKMHLFRYAGEHLKFEAGRRVGIVDLGFAKLGLAICFDLRFPELFRKLVAQGAEILIIPSAWPQDRLQHFKALLQARAIENQCFVIGVNKVGKDANMGTYGGYSMVFDPWGEKLGELKGQRGILTLTLDLKKVAEIRKKYPFLESRVLK